MVFALKKAASPCCNCFVFSLFLKHAYGTTAATTPMCLNPFSVPARRLRVRLMHWRNVLPCPIPTGCLPEVYSANIGIIDLVGQQCHDALSGILTDVAFAEWPSLGGLVWCYSCIHAGDVAPLEVDLESGTSVLGPDFTPKIQAGYYAVDGASTEAGEQEASSCPLGIVWFCPVPPTAEGCEDSQPR